MANGEEITTGLGKTGAVGDPDWHTKETLIGGSDTPVWSLVLCHHADHPERVGEVAFVPETGACYFGRGATKRTWTNKDGTMAVEPLNFGVQTPGITHKGTPCPAANHETAGVSRVHMVFRQVGDTLEVIVGGQLGILRNETDTYHHEETFSMHEGDTLRLKDVIVLLVEKRPRQLAPTPWYNVVKSTATGGEDPLVGQSPTMVAFKDRLAHIALGLEEEPEHIKSANIGAKDAWIRSQNVLLLGESHAGKGLAAEMLWLWSRRPKDKDKYEPVNLPALPKGTLMSDLFGHAKDAFTGAGPARRGVFERLNRGTVLLDEFGEVSHDVAMRLQQVLQKRQFHIVGGGLVHVDITVIAATNRPEQQLRTDICNRMGHVVRVPPINERRSDIPLLAKVLLLPLPGQKTVRPLSARLVAMLLRANYSANRAGASGNQCNMGLLSNWLKQCNADSFDQTTIDLTLDMHQEILATQQPEIQIPPTPKSISPGPPPSVAKPPTKTWLAQKEKYEKDPPTFWADLESCGNVDATLADRWGIHRATIGRLRQSLSSKSNATGTPSE